MWFVGDFVCFELEPGQSFKVFKWTFLCMNFLFVVFLFAFKFTVTKLQILWWTLFTLLSCLFFSLWEISYKLCDKIQLRVRFLLCHRIWMFACCQGCWVISAYLFKVKETKQRLNLVDVLILLFCQLLNLRRNPNNWIA